MEFSDIISSQAVQTGAGAVLVWLLAEWLQGRNWSNATKVAFVVGLSIVVATVWFFIGNYPSILNAIGKILPWAFGVFAFLSKGLGWDFFSKREQN